MSSSDVRSDGNDEFPQLTASLSEASIHGLLAAVASNYVKLLKRVVLPQLDLPKSYTVRDLQIISTLNESAKPLTSSAIFRRTHLDPATVTRSTKQLVSDGYVFMQDNEADSRSRFLSLTPEGRDLARRYNNKCRILFESKDLSITAPSLEDLDRLEKNLKSLQNRVRILSLKNF